MKKIRNRWWSSGSAVVLCLAIVSVSREGAAQVRGRWGIGYAGGYGHIFSENQSDSVIVPTAVGLYLRMGLQLDDVAGVHLTALAGTTVLSYTAGGAAIVDFTFARGQVSLGTGIGAIGYLTLFKLHFPAGIPYLPSGPTSGVLLGAPIQLSWQTVHPAGRGIRTGFRVGLDTLLGVSLGSNLGIGFGFQTLVTLGYEVF